MTEYLLERHPDGTYETFECDEATGDITVRRWADVQPTIDANKAAHLDGDGKGKFAWHAASIPEAVALQWKAEGIDCWRADHWPDVKRRLNDPDWRYLRPSTFRL